MRKIRSVENGEAFYSLPKHAVGVGISYTHSCLCSFHGEDLKQYSTFLFPSPLEQFWGTLQLFDVTSVKKQHV